MHRHELTDSEWAEIELLPPRQPGPRSKRGDRDFINAVIWRARTGVPWRDLPERFGSWQTVYNHFSRWAKCGVWETLFKALRIEDDMGSLLDATVVRAHQDAAGGKGGSNPMLWAALEEVFRPRCTRPRRRSGSRSTSS